MKTSKSSGLFKTPPRPVASKPTSSKTAVNKEVRNNWVADKFTPSKTQEKQERDVTNLTNHNIALAYYCPICNEVMIQPKLPVILAPCGHCFCQLCVQRFERAVPKMDCPICHSAFLSHAPNTTLTMLISSVHIPSNRKEEVINTSEDHKEDVGSKYVQDFKFSSAKHDVLQEEYVEKKINFESLHSEFQTVSSLTNSLAAEHLRLTNELERVGRIFESAKTKLNELTTSKEIEEVSLRKLNEQILKLRMERDKAKYLAMSINSIDKKELVHSRDIEM